MASGSDISLEIGKLMEWVEKEEAVDRINKWGAGPFPYERLAILYRKKKTI
jgi:hypothetical protein